MINTLLMKLSNFYSRLSIEDIPLKVREKARRSLIDFLGEVALGFKKGEAPPSIIRYLLKLGGKEEATILCVHKKVPAIHAAMALGALGHSTELDDGHRWGTSHPAVAIIPAVLALGEREGKSLREMLGAIVVGYDVMLRVARAINPSHLKRGFHSTGTCGSLGSAAACAFLKGFDDTKMAFSIAIGGLQSAGIQEMLHDNPSIKVLQAGHAAMAGVLAVDLVEEGARGPRTLFEGKHGWLKAMCNGEYDENAIIGDLGERWEISFTYTKLYPTCRHCHAPIDLAIEAREKLNIKSVNDVKEVLIKSYTLGILEVGQISLPSSFEEAMFSLPFAIAIAIERGRVTLEDYDERTLKNETLRKFAKERVKIYADPEMDRLYPHERGAYLRLVTGDGRIYENKVPVALGEPERPINDEMLYRKLHLMLKPHYPEDFLKELWEIVIDRGLRDASYEDIIEIFRRYVKNG
ncbi:MAG: MmgE/PrpD family protein [Synergistetes bacterium]|nr:MmgE/PrpD family protein [Synergistota bacterium]